MDAIKAFKKQERREEQMAAQVGVRLFRAAIYAAVIYILLSQQSVFDGSYILVTVAFTALSMINSTQRVLQVLIGLLAFVVLLSDPINRAISLL